MTSLLAYLLIPLSSAVIIQFLKKNDKLADIVSNVSLFAGLLNISYLIFNPQNVRFSFASIADNGFSLIMVLAIYLIAFCVSLFSSGFIPRTKNKHNFYSLLLTGVAAMCGVVISLDFFTLYIYAEALAIVSLAMICYEDNERGAEGAVKYFFLTLPGSVFILTGISILLFTAGTFNFLNLQSIANSGPMSTANMVAVAFLCIGFLIKAGIVPFHTWLIDAYQGAYSPVSAFLGGIATKVSGAYAIIKIVMIFKLFESTAGRISEALMLLGAITIIWGAIAAIRQKNFKRMLAFSSISQTGYIVLASGLGTPLAVLGAIFHLFNQATFKGTLFLNSASIEKSAGTTNMHKLANLENSMPWTTWTSIIALLAAAGLPPLSGFWSKLVIVLALWEEGAKGYAFLSLFFMLVTFAHFAIIQKKIFFGKKAADGEKSREMPVFMLLPVVLLSMIIILAGIFFPHVYSFLMQAVTRNML